MATSKLSRSRSGRVSRRAQIPDRPVTRAERLAAIEELRKAEGFYRCRPENRLVGRYPAETIKHCADAINSLAGPNAYGAIMIMIADALGHAEAVIRESGAVSDFEMGRQRVYAEAYLRAMQAKDESHDAGRTAQEVRP